MSQKKRPQIRQIVQGGSGAYADAMPDNTVRQTLLFSATFPREVQRLAEVRVYSLSLKHTHTLSRSRYLCTLSLSHTLSLSLSHGRMYSLSLSITHSLPLCMSTPVHVVFDMGSNLHVL